MTRILLTRSVQGVYTHFCPQQNIHATHEVALSAAERCTMSKFDLRGIALGISLYGNLILSSPKDSQVIFESDFPILKSYYLVHGIIKGRVAKEWSPRRAKSLDYSAKRQWRVTWLWKHLQQVPTTPSSFSAKWRYTPWIFRLFPLGGVEHTMTASHENGAVESLIKSARQALAAFFKESSLYREKVQNVLTRSYIFAQRATPLS